MSKSKCVTDKLVRENKPLHRRIPGLKRAEEAVKGSEDLFKRLFEESPASIALVDTKGILQKANESLLKLLAISREELIGKDFGMLASGFGLNIQQQLVDFRERLAGGTAVNELTFLNCEGKQKTVIVQSSNFRSGDQVIGVLYILQDITIRKQALEALRQSEELFSEFLRHSPIYAFIKTVTPTESRVIKASENFRQMIGSLGEEMVGKTMADLFPAEFAAKITADDWAVAAKGGVLKLDETFNGRDYTTLKFSIVQGGKTFLAGYSIDITERKKAEEQIRMQLEELSHVTRVATMGELASSLAHEINQPLAAILSNAQAALRFIDAAKPNLEEVREALKDIINDDQLAANVIKELRALMKKEEPHREPLDIFRVIEEVLTLITSVFIIRSVKIKRDIPADLPPVHGSRVQMQQVLINLVNNGCEAMRETVPGERVLTIRAYTKNPESIVVEVIDCGQGLSEGTLEKIFKPFFTTKPKGLGMGLAISRSIIEAHGGSLTARNNPGKGATLSFTLPATGMKS